MSRYVDALYPAKVVGFDSTSSLYSVKCNDGESLKDVELHEMLREEAVEGERAEGEGEVRRVTRTSLRADGGFLDGAANKNAPALLAGALIVLVTEGCEASEPQVDEAFQLWGGGMQGSSLCMVAKPGFWETCSTITHPRHRQPTPQSPMPNPLQAEGLLQLEEDASKGRLPWGEAGAAQIK